MYEVFIFAIISPRNVHHIFAILDKISLFAYYSVEYPQM